MRLLFSLNIESSVFPWNGIDIKMSTYILMKIFERTPKTYDKDLRFITRGKLEKAYDELTQHIKKGDLVLDLGCGTGALTLRAAERGARVKGIDINSRMLEIAKGRIEEAKLSENIELFEMGVAELGGEDDEMYDAVMSGLCFSELSDYEFSFAVNQVERMLKPGGLLLIADEVSPKNIFKKLFNLKLRILFMIITFLHTQRTTKARSNIQEKITSSGFLIESLRLNALENFMELVAKKPQGKRH